MARFVAPWAIAEVAHDGQQALQMIRARMANNEPFDLILLDVMMPILDGQQALAELRQLEHSHGIQHAYRARVVMTTALDDGTSITAAFRMKCDAYLVKPIRQAELHKRIEEFGFQQSC
jgi:two-component system chemotaxis response regulator CheY